MQPFLVDAAFITEVFLHVLMEVTLTVTIVIAFTENLIIMEAEKCTF